MTGNGKFIWTTKINDKGQIVIPKEAREVFGYNSGDVLLLLGDTERGIAIGKADDYVKFAEAILNKTCDKGGKGGDIND